MREGMERRGRGIHGKGEGKRGCMGKGRLDTNTREEGEAWIARWGLGDDEDT